MNSTKRIQSIDFVRGLVMIIMALDHVRDLLHKTSLTQSPLDLNTTTPVLFFTRWITHLCAPTFVFLSGASAYLSYQNKNNYRRSRGFLFKRGLWLIFLELTLINFVLWFDARFRIEWIQVIAAIGFGFIFLSLLLRVRAKWLAVIALIIIAGHDLITTLPDSKNAVVHAVEGVLFKRTFFQISPDFIFLVAYPLIPWFGIMLLGFACGKMFAQEEVQRKKFALAAGIVSLAVFFLLRLINVYGDPSHWQTQKDPAFTVMSFFNVSKYPPSLIYTSLFLGITFVLLYLFDSVKNRFTDIISVYGKVPMFYYILHLCVIRVALFIMVFAEGFHWKDLSFAPFQFGRPASGSGISLAGVYLVWLAIVALLYPICKWYAKYKFSNRHKWWLSYL